LAFWQPNLVFQRETTGESDGLSDILPLFDMQVKSAMDEYVPLRHLTIKMSGQDRVLFMVFGADTVPSMDVISNAEPTKEGRITFRNYFNKNDNMKIHRYIAVVQFEKETTLYARIVADGSIKFARPKKAGLQKKAAAVELENDDYHPQYGAGINDYRFIGDPILPTRFLSLRPFTGDQSANMTMAEATELAPTLFPEVITLSKDLILYHMDGRADGYATSWQCVQDFSDCQGAEDRFFMQNYPFYQNVAFQTRPPKITSMHSALNVRSYKLMRDFKVDAVHVFLGRDTNSGIFNRDFPDMIEQMRMALKDAKSPMYKAINALVAKNRQEPFSIQCVVVWNHYVSFHDAVASEDDCAVVFLQSFNAADATFLRDLYPHTIALQSRMLANVKVITKESMTHLNKSLVDSMAAGILNAK